MSDLGSALQRSKTWEDLYQFISSDPQAGKIFEKFTKLYFLCEATVCHEYKNVWLFEEVPLKIRQKLGIGNRDYGIDLILEDQEGGLSVVQCKFKTNQNKTISWTKDKLANLLADGDKADFFIFFTNASGVDKHTTSKKENKIRAFTQGNLIELSPGTLEAMYQLHERNIPKIQTKKLPRSYQKMAIDSVITEFETVDRGQLILPCGTGKTLISLWIQEQLNPQYTLVLFPSLALLRQTKNEWSANRQEYVPYMCVCSEKDIDKLGDSPSMSVYEIGGLVSTDPTEIRQFLQSHSKVIIFSTYQSLKAVALAIKETDISFSLALCDEAHKTAGSKRGAYGLIHDESAISVKKRLYMTATPRIIGENVKNKLNQEEIGYIAQMDDPEVFGRELYRMSFREAIDQDILVDYRIVAMGVSDLEIQALIKERKYVADDLTADEIANNFALEKFMEKYQTVHAITFHSSVRRAKDFKERQERLFHEGTEVFHVNGKQSTNERSTLLKEFELSPRSIVTNSRCLTEGVDIPAIDTVYFCDPKSSKIDIVQAAGRVLRRADHLGKTMGYIVVPIFHNQQENVELAIQEGGFKDLINVVRALSSHDERLTDEIRSIKLGKGERQSSSSHLEIDDELELIALEDMGDLRQHLFSQVINTFHLPWLSFEGAREFVRGLSLKSGKEWKNYYKSGEKPDDIPSNPVGVYKDKGWSSWGDWLGTGVIASYLKSYKSFDEARTFAHGLRFKSREYWTNYCKSEQKPDDIPASPPRTYKDKGWTSWGDWLGTDVIATHLRIYKPFEEARTLARSLNLKTGEEWQTYCKSGEKPDDIPASPPRTYKDKGWTSWGDWLGTDVIANQLKTYKPFEEARTLARSLNLKTGEEWQTYCKNGQKPDDIPADPVGVYKEMGWVSMGDWLGTGTIATHLRIYKPFEEARTFARSLNLKGHEDWKNYCKSGQKPDDIPADPNQTYKDKGWESMGDWLGTGVIANQLKTYKPFEEAKTFAHSLNLKGQEDWKNYCKSGEKPDDIPANPAGVYKDKGWKSTGDWLGTGSIALFLRIYKPFDEARIFTRSLNLKGKEDWGNYCKSGTKPDDIPANPPQTYKDHGWSSWGDWLGTGTIATHLRIYKPFEEARTFAHGLNLKGHKEWVEYCKSGTKPDDIPASPPQTYKDKGWSSWGDWLGTGSIAPKYRIFKPFEEARTFTHSLSLKTVEEWKNYCKSGQKPDDIPASPSKTYKDKGWESMGDWLGTGSIHPKNRIYKPFEEARTLARSLNLKTGEEWQTYCKSGQKLDDIPAFPNQTYIDKGWVSMGDWLGTGTIATHLRIYKPFEEARTFARSLNIKGQKDWKKYCKSGDKPDDIPTYPESKYKDKGWVSMRDWLGS